MVDELIWDARARYLQAQNLAKKSILITVVPKTIKIKINKQDLTQITNIVLDWLTSFPTKI